MNKYHDIKNLKGMVEYCLNKYPETRNSDITLMITLWREFYSEYLMDSSVPFGSLYKLPREDNIKRLRAWFNSTNDGKKNRQYLPTIIGVVKARKINEDEWRVAMGYPVIGTPEDPGPSWTPPSLATSDDIQSKNQSNLL